MYTNITNTQTITKSPYYSETTIDLKARDFLERLRVFRERHQKQEFRPEHAALLVIDMQNFFFDKSNHAYIPSMQAIIPKVKNLQNAFLTNNLMVRQLQHGNDLNNGKQMLNWWGNINAADNPLSEIIPDIKNPKIPIIKKAQYDVFLDTDLEQQLQAHHITQVVITGVMTHLCCETTARAAFTRGVEVFVVVDGMATYNEDFHFASLLNLAHGFALPVLAEELLEKMDRFQVALNEQ